MDYSTLIESKIYCIVFLDIKKKLFFIVMYAHID